MTKNVEITIDINAARTMLSVAGFYDVSKMSEDEVFSKVLERLETYGAKAEVKGTNIQGKIKELYETIEELSRSDGTLSQKETSQFLFHFMSEIGLIER